MIRRLIRYFQRPRTRDDMTRVTAKLELQRVRNDYDWIDKELRTLKRQ